MSRGKEQSPLTQTKRSQKNSTTDSPSPLRSSSSKVKNTDAHQSRPEVSKTNTTTTTTTTTTTQATNTTKEIVQTNPNTYSDNILYKNKKIVLATIILILVSIYLSTWQADIKHLPSFSDFTSNYYSLSRDEGRPGIYMKERGYRSHFPVVLLPGTVSTGLEVWEGSDCAHRYFRQRMWGHVTMLQSLVLDKNCWMNHVRLDEQTFQDPPGVKLRPAQGLEAADYLMPGYWVWGKMIENLADIGYDNNNLFMASYDWRLAFVHLQSRDHYFDKLKAMIETASRTNHNRKVVLISHSMGASLLLFFQNWVEKQEAGWVEKWLEASINVGPSWLGSAKAIAILASGEMRDTAQLGYLEAALVDTFFSQKERTELFRTWGSIASLLPKGGLPIWGHLNSAPDDVEYEGEVEEDLKKPSYGRMLSFPATSGLNNLTADDVLEHLANLTGPNFKKVILEEAYSFGIASEKELNNKDSDYHKLPKFWSNPLESQLPNAPNYKIYSLYGVGKSTERAYYYKNSTGSSAESTVFGSASLRALYKALGYSQSQIPLQKAVDSEVQDFGEESYQESAENGDEFEETSNNKNNVSEDSPEGASTTRFVIDKTVNDPRLLLEFGVQNAEGDGTIPLLSLGYMCVEGWVKHKRFNPWNVSCINREYQHIPLSLLQDIRGGPYTADHVDIMGNYHLNEDVIRIVSGKQEEVEERILSPIREFAAKVNIPP